MSDATETTGPTDAPVRSTGSVLGLLGALIAVPVLVLVAIVCLRGGGGGGAGTGEQLANAVDEDRIQAVYMANDDVFFGRVRDGDGAVFTLHDAFFLRRTEATGDDKDAEGDLNLVSVAQDVGGDGDLVINAGEVVRIQDLAKDAELATSIEEATK